jgi:hypothetical protein
VIVLEIVGVILGVAAVVYMVVALVDPGRF